MNKEEQEKFNLSFAFWVGVIFAVVGAIFNLWYSTVFGLIVMISIRWVELDKEEHNGKNN